MINEIVECDLASLLIIILKIFEKYTLLNVKGFSCMRLSFLIFANIFQSRAFAPAAFMEYRDIVRLFQPRETMEG